MPVFLICGFFGDDYIRILVADDGKTLRYIQRMAFTECTKVENCGYIPSITAHKLTRRNADLVVVGTNCLLTKHFARHGFYILPQWVRTILHVKAPPDAHIDRLGRKIQNDVRRNLRRLKDNGISYRITHDPDWFDMFYHSMYKPLAIARYGDLSILRPYKYVKHSFNSGCGIAISKNGEDIAGEIAYIRDLCLYSTSVGVLNGDVNIARSGVLQAFYCCDLILAYDHGCNQIDIGASRPSTLAN